MVVLGGGVPRDLLIGATSPRAVADWRSWRGTALHPSSQKN
ncbi:hypothetical protein WHX55_12900 [Pseudomonas fluorescens]